MVDIEKVLTSLECCAVGAECDHCHYAKDNHDNFEGCHQLMADAVELLKEQQDRLEQMILDNADLRNCYEELKDRPQIVRCCKCRKRETIRCPVYPHKRVPDKWFCADGERRDSSS